MVLNFFQPFTALTSNTCLQPQIKVSWLPTVARLVHICLKIGETVGSPLKTTDNSNFQTVAPFVGGSYVLTDYLGLLYSFSFTSLGFTNQQFIGTDLLIKQICKLTVVTQIPKCLLSTLLLLVSRT